MAIVLPWLLFCGYKTVSLMFVKPYIALGWLAPTVTRAEHNMKLAFNICRTRLAFVLKEDLP